MADKFPHIDLPRSVSGGSDAWDDVQAGVILGSEFFGAPADVFAGSASCAASASAGLTVTASSPLQFDSSAPPRVNLPHATGNSATSASFTAPAGSLLVVVAETDQFYVGFTGGVGAATMAIADSGGLTWVKRVERNFNAIVTIWTAEVPTSASRTVTVTRTGTEFIPMSFKVYVVTGHNPSDYIGASGSGSYTTNNNTFDVLTAEQSNSLLFVSAADWTAPGAPTSSDLTYENGHVAGQFSYLGGYRYNAAPGAASVSIDAGGTADVLMTWAALEILPEGGATTQALAGDLAAVASATAALSKTSTQASDVAAIASATGNLSKSSTQSASASAVASTTAGLSKTAVLAGAASGVATVAADLAVSKPLAASVQSVASASAITPPIGKPLTAAVAAISTTSADLTTGALQSLAGAISATSAASAALTKTAALAAGVAAVANIGGAELTLGKPLAGSGGVVVASTGLLSSVHALAGDAQAVGAASATLTKQSAQAGSAGAVASASADLSRTATLAAAVSAQASAALDLTKVAALASNAQAVSVTTANLSLNRNLQASVAAVVVTSADLLVLGDFGGNANASATASAALSLGKPIAGDAQSASNAFASLQVVIPLSGALSVVSIASADPRVAWALSSNVVVQTVTTADVSITKPIAASVASVAAGAADAQVLKRMDASAACVSSASAGLSLTKPIAGAAQSITSVEADLSNDLGGGDAKSVCVAIGGLSIEKPLEGAAVGGAPDIVAALSLTATLAADLITQAAANANVTLAKPLAGAALSVVSISSPLDHTLTLASNVGAQSNSLGALVVRKEMAATLQVQSAANVTPIYLLSLASGITVRSTATLFVPDINFADGVDAVIEMFAIHAAIVSDDKSASIIVDAITVEVDG